jgi:outer membrane protein OmpA-like peptidoglycan-associated protein
MFIFSQFLRKAMGFLARKPMSWHFVMIVWLGTSVCVVPEVAAADPSSTVVIARGNDTKPAQIAISRHGQLHAVLAAGEYTELPICPGDIAFEAVTWQQGDSRGVVRNVVSNGGFDPTRQMYLLELADDGSVHTEVLDKVVLRLTGWSPHRRIVSRVVSNCGASLAATAEVTSKISANIEPSTVIAIELVFDSFQFAQTTINNSHADSQLRERAERALGSLDRQRISKVQVIGHSDPIGQPHRKVLVSLQRAQMVAARLQSVLALPQHLFEIESAADRQLLVTHCSSVPVRQRYACNAPNRRVEVRIVISH